MVNKIVILKAFDDVLTVKCNSSRKARQIGESAVLSTNENGYTLSYANGMSLEFDSDNNMVNLVDNGADFNYFGDDCYDEFDYQRESFQGTGGFTFRRKVRKGLTNEYYWEVHKYEDDYSFLTDYMTNYATIQGLILNKNLNQGSFGRKQLNSFKDIVNNNSSHNYFVELEKNTRCDHKNFVCVRVQNRLYDNDSIDKEFYRNKHHTSASVGADINTIMETFTGDSNPHRRDNARNNIKEEDLVWRVYTKVGKDTGVHGLFFGNNINDSPTRCGDDWEAELNFAPNTKFVRDVIDEKNHIIIQHVET